MGTTGITCGSATPCATNGDCLSGWVCLGNGCGKGDNVRVPPCLLG